MAAVIFSGENISNLRWFGGQSLSLHDRINLESLRKLELKLTDSRGSLSLSQKFTFWERVPLRVRERLQKIIDKLVGEVGLTDGFCLN